MIQYVANKVINGSQCSIVFYVDDNKISHKDLDIVVGDMVDQSLISFWHLARC